MENRKLIYLFGTIFSILFAAFYFLLFDNFITSDASADQTVYYNQVGLYKSTTNSDKTISNLKEHGIEANAVIKDDLTAVICGLSIEESETQKQQETLQSLGISFIEKHIVIEDVETLQQVEEKNYENVLEMIKNESKGNESSGAST